MNLVLLSPEQQTFVSELKERNREDFLSKKKLDASNLVRKV